MNSVEANKMIHKSGNNIFFSPNFHTLLNLQRVDKMVQKENKILVTMSGNECHTFFFNSESDVRLIMITLRDALSK